MKKAPREVPTTGLYVVEWSKSQCQLHVQPLELFLRRSRARFVADDAPPNDYEIVHVGDRKSADLVADQMRPIVAERYERKRKVAA
ncbi:hypothetical protein [Cupriavidus gilardii]|uniref:hypothetical protein n=1 Tax=Cupriavidus gilardii TaxID=82541 RepID=UPI0021B20D8A|nr:hypothetical protein [Cupriavidus gilardii]UXC37337.1 hypothetical protein N4G38_07840 [Cupriavidus gilardii]